jgi:hypothetical protein
VLSSLQKLPYGFVAALTGGVMAFPLPTQAADQTSEPPSLSSASSITTADPATSAAPDDSDDESAPDDGSGTATPADDPALSGADAEADEAAANTCLVQTICSVKQKIRWQTPAWTPSECQNIAGAVAAAAKRHDLPPALLLAIMINESDMNERAFRVSTRDGKVYAKDGGLMAIRCVVNKNDHCVNGNVRGLSWKQLMDPMTNIEVGARELAYWRDGGGVVSRTVRRRDGQEVTKTVPCRHLTHAWWAHYNHGPRYIDKGYPRHYPHRIAVLDHALATVMNVDAPELKVRITVHDAGKRERTIDRPLEQRFKKLYNQILSSAACAPLALLN